MERGIRRREVLATGAAALSGLAGCGGILGGGGNDNPFNEVDADTGWQIKIGMLVPQSGSLETFGPDIADAGKLVQRQIGASKNEFELDLEIKDTESDPGTAVSKAQELLDDGYEVIVGPGSAEASIEVTKDVLVPEEVVAMSPLAATGLVNLDDKDFLFSTAPRASKLGIGLSRPLAIEGVGSVSIINTANNYGTSIGTVAKEEVETRGLDVPARVEIEDLEASSYTSVLEEALADDPEALIIAADPVVGIQVLKDFYADFGDQQLFLTDRLRLPTLPSELGGSLEGTRVVSIRPGWDRPAIGTGDEEETRTDGTPTPTATGEDTELLTRFTEAFQIAYERFPTIQAGQAFDATAVLTLAAIMAGQDNYGGARVRDQIRKVANEQSQYSDVRGYDWADYWEGATLIADGVRNDYSGATGFVEFDEGTGQLKLPELHAAKFSSENPSGFEEVLPIPTST